jgi:hypothetical protein
MSQTVNFKWPQGEDLEIALIYKEGGSENSASAVSLSSGYDARMDIVLPATKDVLHTADFPGAIALGTGANKAPNIVVSLPRSLTLEGGVLFTNLTTTTNFNYDLFLRNTTTDKQVKILRGQINIERSNTLWL